MGRSPDGSLRRGIASMPSVAAAEAGSELPPVVAAARDAIVRRWALDSAPDGHDNVRTLIEIYDGLHGLFGSSMDTERAWLDERNALLGDTPRWFIENGRIEEVLSVINFACGRR